MGKTFGSPRVAAVPSEWSAPRDRTAYSTGASPDSVRRTAPRIKGSF